MKHLASTGFFCLEAAASMFGAASAFADADHIRVVMVSHAPDADSLAERDEEYLQARCEGDGSRNRIPEPVVGRHCRYGAGSSSGPPRPMQMAYSLQSPTTTC